MTRSTTAENVAPGAEDERAKSRKISTLSALIPFILPYKLTAILAGAALVATALVSLALPLAVRRVVDNFGTENTQLLDQYFGAAVAIAAVLAIGTGLRYALVTRLGERVIADIRMAVFDKVIGMSPRFYERIMTGEVLSRLTTDTTLLLSVIGSSVSIALRNVLIFVGGFILMLLTSAKLAALVLLIVPCVIVPILFLGRRLRALSRENQDWIAASSGEAAQSLGAVQTIQAFTHEVESRGQFADVTKRSYRSARRRIVTRAVMTVIVIFLVFTGIVGVLWIGARDVRMGEMTVGALVQFVIYSVMVAGAVAALSEIWGELQRAAGATERLIELLNAQDEVSDPVAPVELPSPTKGRIEFDTVSFVYPARTDAPALDRLSFVIEPGETVAFVGPSGAGKTTIFQLLLRFFAPTSGAIRLDGIDMADVDRHALRKEMALVAQDPVIFATSVEENIRFGRPSASQSDIVAAAQAAAAHDFIQNMPQDYDSQLGEKGIMLSGGQRQRIAIARAILRNAPILLLDEATSALDAESERAVQLAVDELSAGRTTLIVAHRLATVKKADRIIVLDQGRVVAQGTHEQLVAQEGLYARLARLQFTDGLATE